MEYPGVRLGQRGGLYDLYQYYLGGGDESQDTGSMGPVTTVPMPVTTGGGDNLQYNEMPVLSAKDYGLDNVAINNPYYMPNDPLNPMRLRGMEPEEYSLAKSIVGDRGLKTIRKSDDDEEVIPGMEFFTKKYDALPGYVKQYALPTAIGAMNPIIGGALTLNKFMRPDATESALGIGGLYASEANLAEDLAQAGLLVDAGNQGIKTITGKNFVSLMGGYEEGQQEIYDDFISKYGSEEEVEDWFQDTYSKKVSGDVTKSFKYKQWQESKFNKDRTDIMTANTIANMKSYTPPVTGIDIHRDDRPTGDEPTITSTQTVSDAQKQHQVHTPTPRAPDFVTRGGDGGGANYDSGTAGTSAGKSSSRGRTDRGWGWKDGGLVRKPYGNGGIVDLL
jgi:hypothetical protein